MKIIKSFANRAYKSTQVNWAKTQASIYKMLGELGIYQIRITNMKDKFALEFLVELEEGQKPRGVRIIVPVKFQEGDETKRTRELNIVHRILFNHLKAKFIAIQAGLTEFEEEFMAHLLIVDNKGNSTTVGELMLPQYNKAIEEGRGGDFKLLPDPREKHE